MHMTGRLKELFAAFGLALIFWSLLASFSGLFNGGFLLWDDIILADLHAGLKSTGFRELYTRLVQKDLDIRFRPLALLHYLTMARLHGLNYAGLLWHNLIIASLTSSFLYGTARNLGLSIWTSFLFIAVTCMGNQGVFALRLVLAENPGMLFIALSAWTLTLGKRIPAALFFTLAALTKESFVLLAPAWILADQMLRPEASWQAYAKKQWSFILAVAIPSLLILSVIIFRVGTHAIGYAGVDKESFSPMHLLRSLVTVLFIKGYGLALLPFLIGFYKGPAHTAAKSSMFWQAATLCALVALPQTFLYAKSGIFMHYLLPAQLWSGLAVLMLWSNPMGIAPRFHFYFQGVVCVLLVFNFALLARNAHDIATWGRDARQALNAVSDRTMPGDTILIIGHPIRDYEKATDAAGFLASDLHERPNASILPTTVTDTTATDHERKLLRRFLDANRTFIERRSQLFKQASCILFMPGAMADLRKNDTTGTGIDGLDTTRVASYLIATHGHK